MVPWVGAGPGEEALGVQTTSCTLASFVLLRVIWMLSPALETGFVSSTGSMPILMGIDPPCLSLCACGHGAT